MRRPRLPRDRAAPVVAWRIVIVLLGVLAEAWNIRLMLGSGQRASEHFAYFTVHANILVIVVMVWMLAVPQERSPRWFAYLRGAVTSYIVLTGILYTALLAKQGDAWSWPLDVTSAVQHRIIPWMVGLDWLLVPTAHRIRVRHAGLWLLYPIGFLIASDLRGALVDGWFTYPFLDPRLHGGWYGLALPVGQVVAAFVIGVFLVAWIGKVRYQPARSPSRRPPAPSATALEASPSSTSSSPHSNSSPKA